MIDGLQGENGDLNNEFLKKKSKSVGRKYLEALRRISQACKMAVKFRKLKDTISQLKADFAAILHACESLLSASRYLRPTLLDFFLQIFDV